MAEYTQRGKRKCTTCKIETTKKICPQCGKTTAGTGNWTVRFRFVENGKVVYKRLSKNPTVFKTKKDAELGMIKFLNEHQQGTLDNISTLIFDNAYNQFIDAKANEIKESSIYTFESLFKNYITPYFANKDLKKITKLDYFNWMNLLNEKGLSVKYISMIKGVMINFLNWVESIFDVPNLLIKLPKTKKQINYSEMQFYDYDQWKLFQEAVKNDTIYDTLFNFQYFMGTRIGEAIALNDYDIDFDKNIVNITKSLTRKVKGAPYKITSPKNKSSIREISMPNIIVEKLKKYLNWKHKEGIASDFLFGGTKPLSDNTYARRFQHYSILAKLPVIRIHDLRHSHASLLINNGANVMLVAKRMGHSTPTETLNRYAKLFKSAEDEIIKKLNNLQG